MSTTKIHMNDILNSTFNKPVESVDSRVVASLMTGKVKPVPEDILQKSGKMLVHIQISKFVEGGSVEITADIDNTDDLDAFLNKTEDYMPRPGGALARMVRGIKGWIDRWARR